MTVAYSDGDPELTVPRYEKDIAAVLTFLPELKEGEELYMCFDGDELREVSVEERRVILMRI